MIRSDLPENIREVKCSVELLEQCSKVFFF